MLETLMYAALGLAYIAACDAEKKEEQQAKKEAEDLQKELDEIDRKTNLDIMFFYYSWYNNISYNDVVKNYKNGTITLAQLEKCYREHS